MRARRESILPSAAERCAGAGQAPKRVRAAGNAVRRPLGGRIGSCFRKRNLESGAPIYAAVTKFLFLKQRSEEHTSELQSRGHLVCRLLLEKKKKENM